MKWRDNDFHVSELLTAHTPESTGIERSLGKTEEFKFVCHQVQEYFQQKNERRSEDDIKKWQTLQHEAVIGKPKAVQLFKDEIEEFLRQAQLLHTPKPSYYDSLVEAVFQETFGLGPISTWWKHPKFKESQSAYIFGKEICFNIPGEPSQRSYSYESEEQVIENIVEKIRMKDEFSHISKHKPELEISLEDGTRVTILIPPRVLKPTIIFRHDMIRKATFTDFVERKSIPQEAVPILRAIAKSLLNLVVMGKVRSGKTTLIRALFDERYKENKVAVTIENGHHELKLSDVYPGAQLIEMIAKTEQEFDEIFAQVLRSDYSFCVIGELRGIEAEIFLQACTRGEGGSMTTYHTDQVRNLPGQIARLVQQRYPGRSYNEELIRVAENLHIGIVMKELPDGSKQLFKISEFRLDPYTLEVSSHDIMRYDRRKKDWTYRFDLSEDVQEKMLEYAPEYAEIAFESLRRLEAEKPMTGSNVEIATSSIVRQGGA